VGHDFPPDGRFRWKTSLCERGSVLTVARRGIAPDRCAGGGPLILSKRMWGHSARSARPGRVDVKPRFDGIFCRRLVVCERLHGGSGLEWRSRPAVEFYGKPNQLIESLDTLTTTAELALDVSEQFHTHAFGVVPMCSSGGSRWRRQRSEPFFSGSGDSLA